MSIFISVTDDHSSHLVQVYIGMAAAIFVLICIVAATVRTKQKECILMRLRNRKAPKIRLQVRKDIITKPEGRTRNDSIDACSDRLETDAQSLHCEIDKGYCEIWEVSESHHT